MYARSPEILTDEKLGGTTPLEVIIKFPKNDNDIVDEEDEWEENEGEDDESKYSYYKVFSVTSSY